MLGLGGVRSRGESGSRGRGTTGPSEGGHPDFMGGQVEDGYDYQGGGGEYSWNISNRHHAQVVRSTDAGDNLALAELR